MKIWSQCGAVCIAPEDDEERQACEIAHEEWRNASEWIRDGYLRQAIEVLAAADQAESASAKASGYQDRMRVEYRELTARAGRLRDML